MKARFIESAPPLIDPELFGAVCVQTFKYELQKEEGKSPLTSLFWNKAFETDTRRFDLERSQELHKPQKRLA